MNKLNTLPVQWRGVIYNVTSCYPQDKLKLILSRWPNGYIELINIGEQVTTSSPKAKTLIIKQTLALAKEDLDFSKSFEEIIVQLKELAEHEPVKTRPLYYRNTAMRKQVKISI